MLQRNDTAENPTVSPLIRFERTLVERKSRIAMSVMRSHTYESLFHSTETRSMKSLRLIKGTKLVIMIAFVKRIKV